MLAAVRFGSLLRRAAGHAPITAAGWWRRATQARITRRYRPDTLILETQFETRDGAATLVDFMPFRSDHSEIVRLVIGTRGKLKMHTELILRFGYGAVVPWVTRLEDGTLRAIAGPDMAVLRTPVHVKGEDMTTVGEFTIGRGETIPLVLTYARSHKTLPEAVDPTASLEATENFWRQWSAKCRPAGEWSEAVKRSMITLKALTYAPTGGIVAAPTTSLPERLGGERNWDYRFCWLRDATLTLLGAMHAGYYEEAQAWREWLLRAVAGSPDQLQIMYGIGGERRLAEWVADWLPGYEKSAPVRIGNAAHTQLQLDVFGEIMDMHYQARRGGLIGQRIRMGRSARVSRTSDENLARAGPGHLGNARAGAAFHLFQGHGLGRLRPRHQERGDVRARRPARRLAQIARGDLRRRLRARLRQQARHLRAGLRLGPARRQPACSFRASASCRSAIRAWQIPSRRSSGA